MCRSRRNLSNEYFLANVGFDTAKNEFPRESGIRTAGPVEDLDALAQRRVPAGEVAEVPREAVQEEALLLPTARPHLLLHHPNLLLGSISGIEEL